jgi:transcriptional antiterminator NusG
VFLCLASLSLYLIFHSLIGWNTPQSFFRATKTSPMSISVTSDYRWYALQCLSNHEDKVSRYLAKYREEDEDFANCLKEVLVPIETVSEVKNGKKKQRDRKFYPGYVFVEMRLFDRHGMLLKDPWYKIKETDGVINFIGRDNPTPLADDEIGRILRQVQEAEGKEVPKVNFGVGEVVKILDGPFLNLTGEIDEIDAAKGTLKVSVSIFGRFTPVELEFWQVEKADEE